MPRVRRRYLISIADGFDPLAALEEGTAQSRNEVASSRTHATLPPVVTADRVSVVRGAGAHEGCGGEIGVAH